MGKIRVKTLGDEEQEKKQKEESRKRKEAKKSADAKAVADKAEKSTVILGSEATPESNKDAGQASMTTLAKPTKKAKFAKQARSASYQAKAAVVDVTKTYTIEQALKLLNDVQRAKFDETVELHINTNTQGVSGTVTLPHGTGKKTRVAIADDAVIAQVEKGIISFDILVAHPSMMPKLAKVARVLGPRGLMPNPKNGTVSPKPEDIVKKFEAGQLQFKTESKAPIIHLSVGKVSFGEKKLSENIDTALSAIKKSNIRNVTLKSTMSPGIKIAVV